jgi:hypothetical protein
MSAGSKWTPGKIFLLVIGILAGLGLICCGAGYFFLGDKFRAAIPLLTDSIQFGERLQKEFGPTATCQFLQNGNAKMILLVGVEGDLTPERVAQVQDGAWRVFAESYREHGFVPVTQLAVGRPEKGARAGHGQVGEWTHNVVDVAELVKRTGIAAPPVTSLMPQGHGAVTVQVSGDGDATPSDPKPADEKKGKEGDGDGGK